MLKTVLSSILGLLVCFLTISIIELAAYFYQGFQHDATPNASIESLTKAMKNIPFIALLMIALSRGIALFVGGIVTKKIHPTSSIPFLVVLLLVLIASISNVSSIPHPIWFVVVDFTGIALMTVFTWFFIMKSARLT